MELTKICFVKTRKKFELKMNITTSKKSFIILAKTTPIFTTFTHNIVLDLLNKHICLHFHRIARNHQTEKRNSSPVAVTHLELLYIVR